MLTNRNEPKSMEVSTCFVFNVRKPQGKKDVRSLRELMIIGLKGVAAYADHAAILGVEKDEIYDFILKALASTTEDLSVDENVIPIVEVP